MAFRRTFAPAIVNSANVKGLRNNPSEELVDGTAKSNKVAEDDYLTTVDLTLNL